jgi:sulfofructose kinase
MTVAVDRARPVRVLFVGALTEDTIFKVDVLPRGPGKVLPTDAVRIAAGMASSAACSAARLGARAVLWASVGDDATGTGLVAQLAAEGVDCTPVRRVPGARSALATILVDSAGERLIVPHYDPVAQQPPDRFPEPDASGFDAVLVDVRWPGAAAMALSAARAAGRPAILDADVASPAVLHALLPLASHVVASQPAAAILAGRTVDAGEGARLLRALSPGMVAVTDGAAGTAYMAAGEDRLRHVPAPRIVAVDTLAAGDVFHGAFAVAVAEGREIAWALRFATAAAALKCQRFGGRLGAPGRAETLAMMQAG